MFTNLKVVLNIQCIYTDIYIYWMYICVEVVGVEDQFHCAGNLNTGNFLNA